MHKIMEGSYMDYLFLFGEWRSAYADLSARNAEKNGKIYLYFEDGRALGYLCTENINETCRILYAYTLPEQRNRGIFTELLKTVKMEASQPVRLNISETKDCFETVRHVLEKLQFQEESSCIIFSGKSEDFKNWERYMEKKGRRLCDVLYEQGFSCTSFADADPALLKQLYDSGTNGFQNKLDVRPFLDNTNKCLDSEMSFMAVKNQVIAAYTLTRRPDQRSAVFEHISVHEDYLGSGCILLPFAATMEMFKKFGCRRAVYAMYENNRHANAFRKKLLGRVTSSQKRSYNFIYKVL